mgnify:CR=1 FL=1
MSTIKVQNIQHTGSSTNAIALASDGTCTANITNNLSNRNKVINGSAIVSQRGTTIHGTSATYTAIDRFSTRTGSSYDFDVEVSQSTDTPDGFSKSLKISPRATSTPSASQNGAIQTKLEGQDVQDFAFGTSSAKSITLSFYAKSGSAGAGTYSIELHFVNASGSIFQQTRAFTVTTSWQRFSFTFEGNGAATSNAVVNNNSDAFRIIWHLASGPDDKASAITTWTVLSSMKTITGMDNFMSSTSNEFYLTGVQLETGSFSSDFQFRSFPEELALCQRYFYMHASGAEAASSNKAPIATGAMYNSGNWNGVINFPVKMRTSPSLYKVEGTDYFIIWGDGGNDSCNSVLLDSSSPQSGTANLTGGLAQTSGTSHWATTYNSATRLGFQAEL